jgi:hypothetical protein
MHFGIRLSKILLLVALTATSLQAHENTTQSSWTRSQAADIKLSQETKIPVLSLVTPGVSHGKTCQRASLGDPDAAINQDIPSGAVQHNGSVGLAVAPDPNNLFLWERKPAILNAECLNQQLEVPRFVFRDGKYYLFTASHIFTFANALKPVGLDALYGFMADNLAGPYEPLNGSGLVPRQPGERADANLCLGGPQRGLVICYVNYYNQR